MCTCVCIGFPELFPEASMSELALCCLFDMAEHLLHVEAPASLHTSRFLSPVCSGCLSSSEAFVPYFLYPKWIFSTRRINPLWLAPMRCGRDSAWKFKPYFAKITRLPSTPIHLHSLTPAFIANLPWFKLLPLFCSALKAWLKVTVAAVMPGWVRRKQVLGSFTHRSWKKLPLSVLM